MIIITACATVHNTTPKIVSGFRGENAIIIVTHTTEDVIVRLNIVHSIGRISQERSWFIVLSLIDVEMVSRYYGRDAIVGKCKSIQLYLSFYIRKTSMNQLRGEKNIHVTVNPLFFFAG